MYKVNPDKVREHHQSVTMTDAQYREHHETQAWIVRIEECKRDLSRSGKFSSARKLIEVIGNAAYLDLVVSVPEDHLEALLRRVNNNDLGVMHMIEQRRLVPDAIWMNYIRAAIGDWPVELPYPSLVEEAKLILRIGYYGFERLVEIFTPNQLSLFVWLYNEGDLDVARVVYNWTPGNLCSEVEHEKMQDTTFEEDLLKVIIMLNHFNDPKPIVDTRHPERDPVAYCIEKLGKRVNDHMLRHRTQFEIYLTLDRAMKGDTIDQDVILGYAIGDEEERLWELFKPTTPALPVPEGYTVENLGEGLYVAKPPLMVKDSDNTVDINDVVCLTILGQDELNRLDTIHLRRFIYDMVSGYIRGDAEMSNRLLSNVMDVGVWTRLTHCAGGKLAELAANNLYRWDYRDMMDSVVKYGMARTAYLMTRCVYNMAWPIIEAKYPGDKPQDFVITEDDMIAYLDKTSPNPRLSDGVLSQLSENNPYGWSYRFMMVSVSRYGKERTEHLMNIGTFTDTLVAIDKMFVQQNEMIDIFSMTKEDVIKYNQPEQAQAQGEEVKVKKGKKPKAIDKIDKRFDLFEKALVEFAESSKIKLEDVAIGKEVEEVDSNYTSNTDNAFALARAYGVTNLDNNHEFEFMNRMHAFRSNITFERMAQIFREMEERQVPMAMVVYLYHWSETPLTMADLTDHHIYANDNSRDWNAICHPGMHLYQLTCVIRRPLFCIEQWDSGEMIAWGSAISRRKIGQRNIDSIVVTPHRWSDEPELREIKILNAKKSVLEIIELGITPQRSKETAKQKGFNLDKILSLTQAKADPVKFVPTSVSYF